MTVTVKVVGGKEPSGHPLLLHPKVVLFIRCSERESACCPT